MITHRLVQLMRGACGFCLRSRTLHVHLHPGQHVLPAEIDTAMLNDQPQEDIEVIERVGIAAVQLHVGLDGPGDGRVVPLQHLRTLAYLGGPYRGEPRPDGSLPSLESVVERAAWWAEIFETPCAVYAPSLDTVETLAGTNAEFVALGDAVWSHPGGPAAGVKAAAAILERQEASR